MFRFLAQCAMFGTLALIASDARAALVIAGSFQGWNPPGGAVMSSLGSGMFEANLSGLSSNTNYLFKILDDGGAPPADWGDPEWTADNNWFRSDGSGNAAVRLNTNIGSTGQNNMNVGITSGSWTPQVVGDFMVAAGGGGNWNPSDASFNMNSSGANQWQKTMTIATPGTFQIKITDGSGWDRQFGSDGFWGNPGTFSFTTFNPNEVVVVNFNSLNPSFSVVPEPSSLMMVTSLVGLFTLVRNRRNSMV
jgi:hypothetical protein